MNQEQFLQQISKHKLELQQLLADYWHQYSNTGTWIFWFNLLLFIIPLIVLYFAIDKKRIFEVCFYGYTVHIIWANIGSVLAEYSYFVHMHDFIYILPDGVNMNSVVLPVTFMLLYQYSTNHGRNVYLWAILGAIFFAFIFAPIEMKLDLVRLKNGMNVFYLFLIDLFVSFVAYWLTLLFLWVKGRYTGKQMEKG